MTLLEMLPADQSQTDEDEAHEVGGAPQRAKIMTRPKRNAAPPMTSTSELQRARSRLP